MTLNGKLTDMAVEACSLVIGKRLVVGARAFLAPHYSLLQACLKRSYTEGVAKCYR